MRSTTGDDDNGSLDEEARVRFRRKGSTNPGNCVLGLDARLLRKTIGALLGARRHLVARQASLERDSA